MYHILQISFRGMDGWMDGWMDAWMDGWMEGGWMDGKLKHT